MKLAQQKLHRGDPNYVREDKQETLVRILHTNTKQNHLYEVCLYQNLKIHENIFTSTIFSTKVRKSPDVSQSDGIANARQ